MIRIVRHSRNVVPYRSRSTLTTPPRTWLQWYSHKLDTHPITTKSITSAIIAGIGDGACQYGQRNQSKWDVNRTGRFFVLGGVLVGPLIHLWYGVLATYLPGTAVTTVIKRVILDQFVFTPFCLPAWLVSLWTLERTEWIGRPDADARPLYEKLHQEAPALIQANWCFWIPVMTVNFGFTPVKYQVLFSNVASLLWNAYMSFTTSRRTMTAKVL
ncbi:protein Mpv17 [Fistulifera solaris]|uniref:Protein Mpv17 n=1 Tax=Fistulifera solaris TaxID=1519565 RepID=A0A1Z5JYC6_FISSO|nr:protein Mpv17 [Fistulifera solaris]|eukprot:GAX18761.1 protein Mpv17 [Fistulifera solaris]